MTKYKLILSYDGTSFSGWQVQPNGVSIQEKLEEAFLILLKEKVNVIGSGRTDAGVHALNQVAHFIFDGPLDCRKITFALNGLLPPGIRIQALLKTDPNFHAQHSAKGKCYYYYLNLDSVKSPFFGPFSWHISRNLDLSAMKAAAKILVGTHDFTSFSNQQHLGACKKDPVRTLFRLDFVDWAYGIRLEFEGDGFLYKMVRNIVGTLQEVGTGKLKVEDIPLILEARDRQRAGHAAPPQGLFLAYVIY